MLQNPVLYSIGIFVVTMATTMSISSGIVANRVSKPIIKSVPQTISTTPTKGAKNCGYGMPIFIKRPTPNAAGKRNF